MPLLTEQHPRPVSDIGDVPMVQWRYLRTIACPQLIAPDASTFREVVEARRSQRAMERGAFRHIVNAVAYATCVRQEMDNDLRHRSRRISPSAGALHPIEVVLVLPGGVPRVFRYNPWSNVLEALVIVNKDAIVAFNRSCAMALPEAYATTAVLLGAPARVAACYDESASLLWRDAGAVIQTLCLTATAFGLASCPLGLLGHEIVAATGMAQEVIALGAVRLGTIPPIDANPHSN